jgi:hypothetical protein
MCVDAQRLVGAHYPAMDAEEVHVVPLVGREHELSAECWCHPEPDPEFPNLLVHNLEQ